MTQPLTDTHIVIVGGSAGIGLATAATAKARGASATLIGRNAERLELASKDIGGARTGVADISDRTQIETVFANMSPIDHLVITAGSLQAGLVAESDPDRLLRAVDERIAGALYVIKAALPLMSFQGSIVLTGGQYSDRPTGQGTALTAMAVRGIEALAQSLALELSPIRVNVIAPGLIDTALFDSLGADIRAGIFRAATKSLPVGRVGTPEEVADAIIFLLTNGYMNGEVLHIDGGGRLV
ncbi:SDR family oxidoreductase [Acidihalobacter yilgarnensis]|uniref:SDR family oxidoreductase n=1 Tax=Acidihalobacter yilgarnensis TaxID=2819280 RepID=UPI0018D44092|nr:SDR family oxidoreductase [Acidihalobacter yilgarnensis]